MKAISLCIFAILIIQIFGQYDVRSTGCGTGILNQEQCGGCWGFSTAMAVADRFCVAGLAGPGLILSPQQILSCETIANQDMGCIGGEPGDAWGFTATNGLPTCTDLCSSGCVPFLNSCTEENDTGKDGCESCPTSCQDGEEYFIQYYTVNPSGYAGFNGDSTISMVESTIMYGGGTVTTVFMVTDDFESFFSSNPTGTYTACTGNHIGGHAVRIVGFGSDSDGNPFWTVANSWGTGWANGGYFNIIQGQNCLGIENQMWWGNASSSGEPRKTSYGVPTAAPELKFIGKHLPGAYMDSTIDHPSVEKAIKFAEEQIRQDLIRSGFAAPSDIRTIVKSVQTQVVAGHKVRLVLAATHSATSEMVELETKIYCDQTSNHVYHGISSVLKGKM